MVLSTFTRILARKPAHNMADGITTQNLGKPDIDLAMQQFNAYIDALRSCNLNVTVLPPNDEFPDGHFIEDPAIVFHDMVFVCRSGEKSREAEGEDIAKHLSHLNQIRIEGDTARVDGGDILFCADRVLIGLSDRTNREGAEQLTTALQSVQSELRVDIVPFSGVLHLKTALNELAPGVFVMGPELQTNYDLSFAEVHVLPEHESYAANLVPINDTLLIADGYPKLAEITGQYYGNKVIALEMSEFEKMDGGLSCLSLRY